MFSKKAQFSIEVLFVIVFLILFIFVFDNLAKDNVYTLEINKIKSDQKEIALLINEYVVSLESINNYDTNYNLESFTSTLKIPDIKIASSKANCDIFILNNLLYIVTDYKNGTNYVESSFPINSSIFSVDLNTSCGQELICNLDAGSIVCN